MQHGSLPEGGDGGDASGGAGGVVQVQQGARPEGGDGGSVGGSAGGGVQVDSLKKRVQIFTACIVETLCSFILAVIAMAPKKDDNQSTGNVKEGSLENVLAQGIISPFAVVNIDAGIIIYSILLSGDLPLPCSDLLFLMYKGSVHFLGLLLMAFASVLLLMDSNGKHLLCLLVLIPTGGFILRNGYYSWQNRQKEDASMYKDCGGRLEASVGFSATVTFLLFLEFQGLVLVEPDDGFSTPLVAISFVCCVAGVFCMTLDTVTLPLLIIPYDKKESDDMCHTLEICNWILAFFLGGTVMFITFETLGHAGLTVLLIPVLVTLCAWIIHTLDGPNDPPAEEEVKAAPLELIKVIFPGFLAISAAVHALGSKDSISIDRHWLVFLTATAVNTCLIWRLLTHVKKPLPATAKVSELVSFCSRLLIAAAVIPFAAMAVGNLKAKK